MALLTINSTVVKTPKKFQVDINDIDGESTRNASGNLIRDRIGTKRKLNCEFPPMTQSEMSTLLGAVAGVFFSVTYQDPILGSTTKTFYVGDRSSPMYRYGNGTTDLMWESLKMNFVEQ
jgi:hypothetical protein